MNSDRWDGRDTGELRVVLYSHDSVGLGHVRRNLAIAHALSEQLPRHRQITGLLVTGEATATGFTRPAGWDWVVLPGIRKQDGRYAPRHLGVGMNKLTSLRSAVTEATLVRFDPHLIIVDRHAYGVDGELVEALDIVRAAKPLCRVVLGLREVLDDPRTAEREWAALGDFEHIRHTFDEIWVYGDPAVHNPLATGEIPPELADKVRFSGYLANGRPCQPGPTGHPKPYLLTRPGIAGTGCAAGRRRAQRRPRPRGPRRSPAVQAGNLGGRPAHVRRRGPSRVGGGLSPRLRVQAAQTLRASVVARYRAAHRNRARRCRCGWRRARVGRRPDRTGHQAVRAAAGGAIPGQRIRADAGAQLQPIPPTRRRRGHPSSRPGRGEGDRRAARGDRRPADPAERCGGAGARAGAPERTRRFPERGDLPVVRYLGPAAAFPRWGRRRACAGRAGGARVGAAARAAACGVGRGHVRAGARRRACATARRRADRGGDDGGARPRGPARGSGDASEPG